MTPKENLLRAITRSNPEWVPNGMENTIFIAPPIVERPAVAGYDAFGVHWSYEPEAEGGTFPTYGLSPITDLKRWRDQINIPDVDEYDWEPVVKLAESIDHEQYLLVGFVEMGLFERSYLLMGMEDVLVAYMTEQVTMLDLLNALADYKISVINKFRDLVPLDMIWYGDDWGTQRGLFMPPDIWRKVIKPPTKRIYDAIHARGMFVNQHSCGKIESIFADMVEMGADLWNPCQPCNDLAALKKEFGDRITFVGGIDSQFILDKPNATADEVREEVRKRIDEMAHGGGYIVCPSHDVPYDPEILNAMNDEIARYGKYPIRSESV